MNHKPRPAIHLEKQLRWSRVSEDLQGGSSSVSQVDGVSNMALACWLHGSAGRGLIKGTMASACLDARHFSFSLYTTGAFQATTLVQELRGSESE